MHDSKDTSSTLELMKKLKLIKTEDDMYDHPMYEEIFCTLHQNEIELTWEFDKKGKGKLLQVKAGGRVLR